MKKESVISIYRKLEQAKLSELEVSDKFKVIRAIGQMRALGKVFDEFVADTRTSLRPDNWTDLAQKANNGESLTTEEQKALQVFEKNMSECVMMELQTDVPEMYSYEKLSEEGFGKLLESNPDWTIAEIMAIKDVISL